ncbi:MAG: NYN domain-containing protein [Flaviflexus sp.]|uniref:NYN domain-containing protein n=1 Tax=Flaviflexus sp. TaxID=1969482 RepID=UPI003F919C20
MNVVKLSRSLRPRQRLVSVKYFTSSVLNDPDAQSRQDHYLDALVAANPTILEVIHGRYQQTERRCFKCGHKCISYEEKETDVNLATSIVVDVAKDIFDTAMIVSADSAVAPAVRAARKIRSNMFIFCAFPPKRSSSELKELMPASFQIGVATIRNAQLPDKFTKNGKHYQRPDKWH